MQSSGSARMAARWSRIDLDQAMSGYAVHLSQASGGHQCQLLIAADIQRPNPCGSTQPPCDMAAASADLPPPSRTSCLDVSSINLEIDEQRSVVHTQSLHVANASARHSAHPQRATQTHAKRLPQELQWQFRGECLNENWFESSAPACEGIAIWRQDHNEVRLHGTIGRIPPPEFAARHRNPQPSTSDTGSFNPATGGALCNSLV